MGPIGSLLGEAFLERGESILHGVMIDEVVMWLIGTVLGVFSPEKFQEAITLLAVTSIWSSILWCLIGEIESSFSSLTRQRQGRF